MELDETYTHGHHRSVLRSHEARTAANSAEYLLKHLRQGLRVLDVGCGPGSITKDLAKIVAPGLVVGIENVKEPLEVAKLVAEHADVANIQFELGDVYNLEYADSSFEIVHAHQVLQHLRSPVEALQEMQRVCVPGGVVAARDADYAAMTWYPAADNLSRWQDLYRALAKINGAEPDAGRRLLSWAQQAGFNHIVPSASVWCYADQESRQAWGHTWAERVTESSFSNQAINQGLASPQELEEIGRAWREWSDQPNGWFTVLHGEILCEV